MTTILLDTHVVQWLTSEPGRLSDRAATAIASATELAVAGPTWFELAWLYQGGRLESRLPLRAWLDGLADGLRTLHVTPAIAARAAELPDDFPRDPFDRIIFATAIEHGISIVTRDSRMWSHDGDGRTVIW